MFNSMSFCKIPQDIRKIIVKYLSWKDTLEYACVCKKASDDIDLKYLTRIRECAHIFNEIDPCLDLHGCMNAVSRFAFLGCDEFVYSCDLNPSYCYLLDRALNSAAHGGHKRLVESLIERGAKSFDLALGMAAKGGHKELIDFLLPKTKMNYDMGFAGAAGGGHRDLMNFFIDKGSTNWNGALFDASNNGHMDIVKLCLENGANRIDQAELYSILGGHMELYKFFREGGGKVEYKICIRYSIRSGNCELFNLLFDQYISKININKEILRDWLSIPLEKDDVDMMKLVIEKLNVKNLEHILQTAIKYSNKKIAKFLIPKVDKSDLINILEIYGGVKSPDRKMILQWIKKALL